MVRAGAYDSDDPGGLEGPKHRRVDSIGGVVGHDEDAIARQPAGESSWSDLIGPGLSGRKGRIQRSAIKLEDFGFDSCDTLDEVAPRAFRAAPAEQFAIYLNHHD